jgi:hypothetical protein
MMRRSLFIATAAAALAAASLCTPAEAADPVAGALIGGGIGAAVGGGPGAAVGAVIGTIAAAADEQYYYDHYGRRVYYDAPRSYAPPARYYEPGPARYYEPAPARYYEAPPVRYYERAYYAPPPVYYPRPVYYAPPVYFGPSFVIGFGGHRHHRHWR